MADFNRFISGNDVITRVFSGMGLPVPVSASESTNAMDRQAWTLLTEVGQEILDNEHQWTVLNKSYSFSTVPGTLEYPMPADFQYFIDSTGWNRDARIPLIGPETPQQWALLQARQLGGTTLRMQFIVSGDKLVFYFVPDSAETLSIDYQSRGWVRDATDPTVYRDYVKNSGDIILFPPRLMVTALKRAWRLAKGFDAAAADEEYQRALEAAKYDDAPKNDLSLTISRGYPYLGPLNMADTGYGL